MTTLKSVETDDLKLWARVRYFLILFLLYNFLFFTFLYFFFRNQERHKHLRVYDRVHTQETSCEV